MATKKNEEIIEIKPVEIKSVKLRIVGDSPLITHAWSAKAKRQILELFATYCDEHGAVSGQPYPVALR